jgi:mannose/fructose/N-acetylgalactosamine-specific phosphotransferase system component IIC
MMPEPGVFLLLILFGGWVALDSTSLGQIMISRPVVAATIAGWIAGDPATGALIGLILEALILTVLPVGAARYAEAGPPAVAAGGALAGSAGESYELLAAVAFALSWAWVGGITVRQQRQANVRVIAAEGVTAGSARALERQHWLAILSDFLRGTVLVAAGIPLLLGVLHLTALGWGLPAGFGRVVLWGVTGAAIAATLRLFGERRAALFAMGVICGLLFLALA